MSERPNILLITTDQQRWDTIHAAGNASIFTPHLDWLCHTGVNFSRCYTDCPVCAPSRATVMTGQHAWRHGQINNDGKPSPMANRPTLPGILTAAGYQTRGEGKMHFHPARANYGFEHMSILPDYYREMRKLAHVSPPMDHGLGQNEMEPGFSTTDERHTATHWTAERGIDFLETRDTTRPFFMWLSFSKPHPPFDPVKHYWDIYDGIPMPDPARGDWSATPDDVPQGFFQPTRHLNNIDTFSVEKIRAVRRAYYALISQIDYNLGLLFARMREMNLLGNTWIFFTSDHGEMLGDHHLGAKSLFLEGSAHVPLLMRPPGQWRGDARGGTTDDRLVCLADILQTSLNIAEVRAPDNLVTDGVNLLDPAAQRTELIGECGDAYVIMEGSLKYHYTALGGGELLFDIASDPYELRNLVKDRKHASKLKAFRSRLLTHLANRKPAEIATGVLPIKPVGTLREQRLGVWPGFHHRTDEGCDLLH
ncbi:MAG: sulfatase-like hydrolase/transferase [Verrucomicrobiota bacterium]|nr:sulfatase-like hydrolase/transferase [Verrucomicrobiota bacterium]